MKTRIVPEGGAFVPEYMVWGGTWMRWPSVFEKGDVKFPTEQLAQRFLKLLSL